jgi:hypothetical protein
MYQNIKTCIRKGEECSVVFNSEVGVKQGENTSLFCSRCFWTTWKSFSFYPVYFIFVVFATILIAKLCRMHFWNQRKNKTVFFEEAISAFEEYCNIWKLTVNTNKTTIVVFSKKKYKTNVVFKIYGQVSMPCLFSNPHTSQE